MFDSGELNKLLLELCALGLSDLVPKALERGAQITYGGIYLTWSAINRGDYKTMRVLLDAGANVDGSGDFKLLARCCAQGRVRIAQLLVDRGADVNAGKVVPLEEALKFGSVELVEMLLRAQASIELVSRECLAWLERHEFEGDEEKIRLLKKYWGSNPRIAALEDQD